MTGPSLLPHTAQPSLLTGQTVLGGREGASPALPWSGSDVINTIAEPDNVLLNDNQSSYPVITPPPRTSQSSAQLDLGPGWLQISHN